MANWTRSSLTDAGQVLALIEPKSAATRGTLGPLAEWHEDMGAVLWWLLPVDEPPYCGQPGDSDWPGYHAHWTPLVVPSNAAGERT